MHSGEDLRGFTGTQDRYMFNVKRNSRISPSGCSIFSFCQQNMRIPDALPSVNTWYCKFLILAILVGITWYLAVALFCISRMTSHAEHLFMGLSAICVSFVKCLLMSFAHFFFSIELSAFLPVSCTTTFHILNSSFFLRSMCGDYLLPTCGLPS